MQVCQIRDRNAQLTAPALSARLEKPLSNLQVHLSNSAVRDLQTFYCLLGPRKAPRCDRVSINQALRGEDESLWDEIEGGREMLKACPQDTGLDDSVARYRGDNDETVFDESYYSDSDMEGAEFVEEDEWDMFEEDVWD